MYWHHHHYHHYAHGSLAGLPTIFATIVIGAIAAYIAWRQYEVGHANLKLSLFEKRYADTPITKVEDAEDLIRSVPTRGVLYSHDQATGALRLSASAFNDPEYKPSVDRRCMRAALDESKRGPTDGLLKVVAAEVRAIKCIEQIGEGGRS